MRCKSILIVEDDIPIQNAIKEALELVGYEKISVANNGKEALDLLNVIEMPCVILLDIMMPIMDGWEFLKKIKEIHSLNVVATIPVLVVSAAYNAEKMSIEKGAEGFIKKPVDLDALYKAVDQFCK